MRQPGTQHDPEVQPERPAPGNIDPAKLRMARRVIAGKMAVAAFGEIITVLMRSPLYRTYNIGDLEWLVTPAVLNRQFSLVHLKDQKAGPAAPVALVMWASVSPEIEQRLLGALGSPIRLSPAERKSGELHWITDAVGDPRIVPVVLHNLRKTTFRGAPVKTVTRRGDGKMQVVQV